MSDEKKFQRFISEQQKAIDEYKYLKGIEMKCDPGRAAVQEWVEKYAKKFREEFTIKDCRENLIDLKNVRINIQQSLDYIQSLLKVIDSCESRIIEDLKDLEKEKNR